MFNEFFFYKLITIDYIFVLIIISQIMLENKNHQEIEKKIILIFIWILIGLPIFYVFFFKINFFLQNVFLLNLFIFFNTTLLILYFNKIKNILNIKKKFKYFKNKQINFNYILLYVFFSFIKIMIFF